MGLSTTTPYTARSGSRWPAAPMLKPADVRKPTPTVWIRFTTAAAGQSNEQTTSSSNASTNTTAMRSMNGSSGHRALIATDRANEPMVAASAPASAARFQNRPSRKITTIPGAKKPVYSWMYWKAWSNWPRSGRAARIASRIATTAAIRPTFTRRASLLGAPDLAVDVEREDRGDEVDLGSSRLNDRRNQCLPRPDRRCRPAVSASSSDTLVLLNQDRVQVSLPRSRAAR